MSEYRLVNYVNHYGITTPNNGLYRLNDEASFNLLVFELNHLSEQLAAAQAENAKLRAALKPFAELAKADDAKTKAHNVIPDFYISTELERAGPDEPIVCFTWGDVNSAAILLYNHASENESE